MCQISIQTFIYTNHQHAKNFATFANMSVGVKEMVHNIFKGVVGHTNYKNVEIDLMKRYNTI